MKTVAVRGTTIGVGTPKICIPLTGKTEKELIEEAELLKTVNFDVVEWRADFFELAEEVEQVINMLGILRESLSVKPIIFTFRRAEEGGHKSISPEYYARLNMAVIESGHADLIDVELFQGEGIVRQLIDRAHNKNLYVIVSNHDFQKTPPKEEILARLRKAQELGGDIPKIAVMPNSPLDVLVLLEATVTMNQNYADRPIITMSMGGQGMISRLAGEIFGSALTFGSVRNVSAPGQIPAEDLQQALSIIHKNS